MIGQEEAALQGKVLCEAADASPLPGIGAVLRERGKEFLRAADDVRLAEQMGRRATIFPVGTIEAGMVVLHRDEARVLRVIRQQGDISLQVHEEGMVAYMNFVSATSPVVVLL